MTTETKPTFPTTDHLTVEELQNGDYYLVGDIFYFGDSWYGPNGLMFYEPDDDYFCREWWEYMGTMFPEFKEAIYKEATKQWFPDRKAKRYEMYTSDGREYAEHVFSDERKVTTASLPELYERCGLTATGFNTGGDGFFADVHGRVYLVECGMFGCVNAKWLCKSRIESIHDYNKKYAAEFPGHALVHFVKLSHGNIVVNDDGDMVFGDNELIKPQDFWGFAPDYEPGDVIDSVDC